MTSSAYGLIGVTGATGGLGGRVAARLATRGDAMRLIVRDPARAPVLPGAAVVAAGYGDAEAMRIALTGVDTLLLVSASESADRVRQHLTAVDAAVAAGVARVVYTSFYGAAPDATFTLARHHYATEEHLRASGLDVTFLRDNLYLDAMPTFTGADGVLRGPAGDGRFAGVAREDIADCAVVTLTQQGHSGQTYDLTGPRALSLYDVAAEMTRASGRPIRYEPETLQQAYASRSHYGAPDWEVEGWVTSYAAIATGELSGVTEHVRNLTGHDPMSFAEYLETDPDAVSRLRA